jgi:hypothetical protein
VEGCWGWDCEGVGIGLSCWRLLGQSFWVKVDLAVQQLLMRNDGKRCGRDLGEKEVVLRKIRRQVRI